MLYKVYKDISTKERKKSKKPPKNPNMQNREKKGEPKFTASHDEYCRMHSSGTSADSETPPGTRNSS